MPCGPSHTQALSMSCPMSWLMLHLSTPGPTPRWPLGTTRFPLTGTAGGHLDSNEAPRVIAPLTPVGDNLAKQALPRTGAVKVARAIKRNSRVRGRIHGRGSGGDRTAIRWRHRFIRSARNVHGTTRRCGHGHEPSLPRHSVSYS